MNSRRLARLMEIICDIKANPRLDPEEMVKRLKISRRQFYKDRDSLNELGFSFHYSRSRSGFVMDKELVFSGGSMSLSGLFSMIMAVSRLNGPHDLPLALAALDGLKNTLGQLPGELAALFAEALNQIVFKDGFKCRPEVLYELLEAVANKQLVMLVERAGDKDRQIQLEPVRLLFHENTLHVDGIGGPGRERGLFKLAKVRRVLRMDSAPQLPFPT